MERPLLNVEQRRLTMESLAILRDPLCSICQLEFRIRDYVIGISCGHGFHTECINQWIETVTLKG